jgi:hypothetical protein
LGVNSNSVSASGGGFQTAGGGDSFLGAGAASGGRIKVVLEGNGDDALTTIIKSGAYEAFLEIIT